MYIIKVVGPRSIAVFSARHFTIVGPETMEMEIWRELGVKETIPLLKNDTIYIMDGLGNTVDTIRMSDV